MNATDELALARVVSVVESFPTQAWSYTPDVEDCREVLSAFKGDVDLSELWLRDLRDAEEGLVEAVRPGTSLMGAENAGNSCYFDSLLFALFAAQTLFDGLLRVALDPAMVPARKFQASLRLFVNQLRRGDLVSRFTVSRMRDDAFAAGFAGVHGLGSGVRTAQEDTSELFLWILGTLQAPYLPLNQRILHGAREEVDDTKYSAERVLALDIPEHYADSRDPVPLERLLEAFFFENRLEITREVEAAPIDFGDERKRAPAPTAHLTVPAFSALKILPFYTPQSQAGDSTDASSAMWGDNLASPQDGSPPSYASVTTPAPRRSLVLPMLVKRYASTTTPPYSRRLPVALAVPTTMKFALFVDDPRGGAADYVLELRSAVLHRGESTGSGHYVSAARTPDGWLKFDDLAPRRVVRPEGYAGELALLDEVGRDGYLLVWELTRGSSGGFPHEDHEMARRLQVEEREGKRGRAPGWDPDSCAMQ
ncbi:hypothetical protein DFJ74DRAFT_74980 [Hyaloraphidium curvatum]|nr:hypothetical protein DFJ74DRAFT_74980 [Hyaloraphidium curvatum]